jgi:hypothetical protein
VVFRQYIPQKHKVFDKKIYNPFKSLRHTYGMRAYIAKQCKNNTAGQTSTTHGTIMQLGKSMEDVGHETYMDN